MILHRRATSPGGGAGRRDLDHVPVAAGVAFAPGRLAIALPVQEQGAKNILFFASYSILSVTQHDSVGSDSVALNCYAMGSERRGCPSSTVRTISSRQGHTGGMSAVARVEPGQTKAVTVCAERHQRCCCSCHVTAGDGTDRV